MSLQFQFDAKKTVQVINYLLNKAEPECTKLKLLKLIFYADREHLRRYGRTITGDNYFALEHGPVASSTKVILDDDTDPKTRSYSSQYLRVVDNRTIESLQETDEDEFSESDQEILDEIIQKYGSLSASKLRAMTHEEKAYIKNWESRGASLSSDMPLEDFFETHEGVAYQKALEISESLSVFK